MPEKRRGTPFGISKLDRAAVLQLLRFSIVGTLVAFIYFVLFVILSISLSPFLANTIAYLSAITFQYFAQSIWTFERNAFDGTQILKFAATMVFAYMVATLVTTFVGPSLDWPSYIAGGVVVVVLPVTNFVIFKIWVFRSR